MKSREISIVPSPSFWITRPAIAVTLAMAFLLVGSQLSAQEYKVLHTFTGGVDGGTPLFVQLVGDSSGNLYGTTSSGGANNDGTIYRVAPGGELTVLYSFSGGNAGAVPVSGVIRDSTGNLYGTTESGGILCFGGPNGCGIFYKLDASNNLSVLYSFLGSTNNNDGGFPQDSLLMDSKGNLYGTTFGGGISTATCQNGAGTVFELSLSGSSWAETQLYKFPCDTTNGAFPEAALISDSAGNLYSTTTGSGTCGSYAQCGTVFELTPGADGWTHTVLHDFTGGADGAELPAGLIRDASGNLYGTTQLGGASGEGTIFRIDTSGNKTILHSFDGSDGAYPYAALILDSAGNFYGTTAYGGSGKVGTVFELSPGGTLTTLHTFTGGSDGAYPEGALLLQDRVLYGVTSAGGSANRGTIFQIGLSATGTQYDVSLYSSTQFEGKPYGQVTVNTGGVTTIQLNGAATDTTYNVEFCPAPAQLYPTCFAVGSISTNASGSADSTVPFPSGQWAGDFQLFLNGQSAFSTSFMQCCFSAKPGQVYYATLQPQSTVNGKGTWTQGGSPPPQDPLQSGYIQMQSSGILVISLTGATPNRQYGGVQCPLFQGSDCYGLSSPNGGSFTTNSAGDATFKGTEGTNIPEDIFYVDDNSTLGFGYIAGFSIP